MLAINKNISYNLVVNKNVNKKQKGGET
jgi:hypothetical protein